MGKINGIGKSDIWFEAQYNEVNNVTFIYICKV